MPQRGGVGDDGGTGNNARCHSHCTYYKFIYMYSCCTAVGILLCLGMFLGHGKI